MDQNRSINGAPIMADRMAKTAHKSPIGISTEPETWRHGKQIGKIYLIATKTLTKYGSLVELILGFSFRVVKAKSSNLRSSRKNKVTE